LLLLTVISLSPFFKAGQTVLGDYSIIIDQISDAKYLLELALDMLLDSHVSAYEFMLFMAVIQDLHAVLVAVGEF